MGLHGEDDVVACPGVSLVTDQMASRLGIHIIRGSMSTLTRISQQERRGVLEFNQFLPLFMTY